MIKVLWMCNIVLPDFSQEFEIKKVNTCGWLTGMFHEMEKRKEVDISFCFPIYDRNKMKKGSCNGHRYYSFLFESEEIYTSGMIEAFEEILDEEKPDIVHIWGTEFPHTTAMLTACKNKGILNRVVINIQGLISVYAKHYRADIPDKYWTLKNERGKSLEKRLIIDERRGKCEIESIKMVKHVIGRTDWDRACVEAVNPQVNYYFCNEILRDAFYEEIGKWEYDKCQKYSIFVSQAAVPRKGFHYLLTALPVIIAKYPETHVYVSGKNIGVKENKSPYALYIKELMEQLELDEYVTFLGMLDEKKMIEQYFRANVFVSASTIENESNSLSEARLIGVPAVSSYVGGAFDRFDSGVDGFLYPHNEPALLAYYIGRIFENRGGLCEQFSGIAVKKMVQIINPQINADKNMAIYREILGE